MRKDYLLLAILITIFTACKKQIQETTPETPASVDAPPDCIGNNWQYVVDYYNTGIAWTYNNKIYIPDKYISSVLTWDGSGWGSFPSQVPFYTHLTIGQEHLNNLDIVAFTIGSKGYIFLPYNPENSQVAITGFWEYNFLNNVWTRKADFPGYRRDRPAYFSIGTKGYVIGGHQSYDQALPEYLGDVWEYNQATNSWTQKLPLPYTPRSGAIGFTAGNKGYIAGGRLPAIQNTPTYTSQLLEFSPVTNIWTLKSVFPGGERTNMSAFVDDDKAYLGGGITSQNGIFKDFYKYDPVAGSWTRIADFPSRTYFGFTINSKGYCIGDFGPADNRIYRYIPKTCFSTTPQLPGNIPLN